MPKIGERIVAKLRLTEDGSLSNKKVEQYALLRSEEVVAVTAAWTIIMTSANGNLPSSGYMVNVHKSPAFKARLEALMSEKAELQEKGGVWGQLEWQAKQLYRKCAALNDVGGMQRATDTLLKVAARTDRSEKPPANEDGETRGPGAPPIEVPMPEDHVANYRVNKLLDR